MDSEQQQAVSAYRDGPRDMSTLTHASLTHEEGGARIDRSHLLLAALCHHLLIPPYLHPNLVPFPALPVNLTPFVHLPAVCQCSGVIVVAADTPSLRPGPNTIELVLQSAGSSGVTEWGSEEEEESRDGAVEGRAEGGTEKWHSEEEGHVEEGSAGLASGGVDRVSFTLLHAIDI